MTSSPAGRAGFQPTPILMKKTEAVKHARQCVGQLRKECDGYYFYHRHYRSEWRTTVIYHKVADARNARRKMLMFETCRAMGMSLTETCRKLRLLHTGAKWEKCLEI